eukprot:10674008-Prorocentrum_lima.AAC.1
MHDPNSPFGRWQAAGGPRGLFPVGYLAVPPAGTAPSSNPPAGWVGSAPSGTPVSQSLAPPPLRPLAQVPGTVGAATATSAPHRRRSVSYTHLRAHETRRHL